MIEPNEMDKLCNDGMVTCNPELPLNEQTPCLLCGQKVGTIHDDSCLLTGIVVGFQETWIE